ncbi:MAG TPA: hypothetical protein VKE69_12465 [Planctomycetota bacterium]|nr:hypothetical protein [Planctomycetota bacterium]
MSLVRTRARTFLPLVAAALPLLLTSAFAAKPLGVVSTLHADASQISISAGGTQHLFLDAGPESAGKKYVVIGSFLGTSPATILGATVVPLVSDRYFIVTLNGAGVSLLTTGASGHLDAQGKATAAIDLPPLSAPTLIGKTVHHAFALFDETTDLYYAASNAVRLTLLP